jgi:hypothetical protein
MDKDNIFYHFMWFVLEWCKQYNDRIPNTDHLKKDIDTFMEKYDAEVSEKAEREKKAMEEDEEGWVTVTKK